MKPVPLTARERKLLRIALRLLADYRAEDPTFLKPKEWEEVRALAEKFSRDT